jgi:hypothetical protein
MNPLMIDQARARGARPRVHPNGFLQLNLVESGNLRLHIWHPELPKQSVRTSVHDHVFHMRSTIEVGVLQQVRFTYTLEHSGDPTAEIYMAEYTAKSDSTLHPTGVQVALATREDQFITVDGTYEQPPFTFHDSVPCTDIVVTVMEKVAKFEGNPRVIVPIGCAPDNSFHREDADEELLWKIIDEAL